ncbi:MAG TPA: type II toxin-antitoxin system VapC family toxin [Silvibacterium sp.]|nr:type II toxin-antitoxin system VapC family toxin [Silvibacterium sp.]
MVTETAFWDTSAFVPLCLQQQNSSRATQLLDQYAMVVWWAAPVEARSALARDLRNGVITGLEHQEATLVLEQMRWDWTEVRPDDSLRSFAETLPDRFPLRAGDALQLAAAWEWVMQRPAGRPFISGDKRLLDAAEQMGFRAIAV